MTPTVGLSTTLLNHLVVIKTGILAEAPGDAGPLGSSLLQFYVQNPNPFSHIIFVWRETYILPLALQTRVTVGSSEQLRRSVQRESSDWTPSRAYLAEVRNSWPAE